MATLTVSTETSPAGVPRVKIIGASFAGTQATLYRVNPDGTRSLVRQAAPVTLSAGGFTVYDYEAPFDFSSSYVEAGGTTSGSVTLTSNGVVWLIHPGIPDTLSVPLTVAEWPQWTRPIQRGVLRPLNRREPIVSAMRRSAEAGTLVVYTLGTVDYQALLTLLETGDPLLLKGTSRERGRSRWVAVGDVQEAVEDLDVEGFVTWTLPLDVVSEPIGYALAAVKYSDASASFLSYTDAKAQAPTYADRTAGLWL